MRCRPAAVLLLLNAILPTLSAIARAEPSGAVSLMQESNAWKTLASEGVSITATREGNGLRVDYAFNAGAGFGGIYLETPLELSENYAFELRVHGTGKPNNLELKLIDVDKVNVWWVNRRAFEWPTESTTLANVRKHFQFAWGPSGGAVALKHVGRIELMIAAAEGGKGSVWIEDLRYGPRPPVLPYTGTPTVSATSGRADARLLTGEASAPWLADAGDTRPCFTIDFGQQREIGGLVIDWAKDHAADAFDLETSADGSAWTTARRVSGINGLPTELWLPELTTRFLRLRCASNTKRSPGIDRIRLIESADATTPNAFWKGRAARADRGLFPRAMLNEQAFWTVVGNAQDDREALISEDGQIEVDKRGFSIEPFIVRDGQLLSWASGTSEASLRDGWAPIPTVLRRHDGLELSITALSAGEPSFLCAKYTLRNTSQQSQSGRLVLAARPIQVLPPWQDLNVVGGWTPIRSVRAEADGLTLNEDKRLFASPSAEIAVSAFDSGDVVQRIMQGDWPAETSAECAQRSATSALAWDYTLAPGEAVSRIIAVPFHDTNKPAALPADEAAFEALATKVESEWKERVERVRFTLPPQARPFLDTIRAQQAYVLINHDGKGFQPGSRTYERSWLRDGSMTSAAMLALGHESVVRDFVDWYLPYQFPSGKAPCVVDRRGPDPVDENDSNGEFIWLLANTYRVTGDVQLVRKHFDRVKACVAFIESQRAQRLTPEFGENGPPRQEAGKPAVPALAFRGLVPESISHEGYSDKPRHSFWDDLFVLRGLADAPLLARAVGDDALADQWQSLADEFRQSVLDSIRLTQKAHGIDYLPGCVELGDFDSTSSTILVWPVEEASRFPRAWIDATFDHYWGEFNKRKASTTWDGMTPYELRHVGVFVRLGQKDRAWAVLDWMMSCQRPAAWHHWAEVVWRERATPRMIGDMPHTWCGSDFLNAACSMFAYGDLSRERLVLLAGVPDAWFDSAEGVGFAGLHTEFGIVTVRAKQAGDQMNVDVEGDVHARGGIELKSPLAKPIRSATVNGTSAAITSENSIVLPTLPATVVLNY